MRMVREAFSGIGEYVVLMRQVLPVLPSGLCSFASLVREIYKQGVDSLGIVMIVSFFIGAVITIQLGINMTSPLVPKFTLGLGVRQDTV